MNNTTPLKRHSLLFAPMEGITDEPYRLAVMNAFPEWDVFSTDFLRVPTEGSFSKKFILEHFGKTVYLNSDLRNKTAFQILANEKGNIPLICQQIDDLGFKHLDLNLGCPSKRVNQHLGGAYLLSDLPALQKIVITIRSNFPHHFTVKMRIGFKDDSNFLDCIKLFEHEGVNAITIHGRTRDQLYKGVADWKYIRMAAKATSVPIIGNGDIWSVSDIQNIFDYTNCHSIMLGRGPQLLGWPLYPKQKKIIITMNYLRLEKKNSILLFFFKKRVL